MEHLHWAQALLSTFRSISPSDILDITVVAGFIYALLLWFEWTQAAFVARGILILGALYVVARQMGMVLTTWIFHGFFAVFAVALVIIFQEEIRRFFERLAVWNWRKPQEPFRPEQVDVLVRSATFYAREKMGALIVLKGRDPLERHMDGGIELDGKISDVLLQSIFDTHSDGHDGAVVLEGGRVQRFGTHLPLSKNLDRLAGLGTRHAAALGLAEVTDAMCLVVSEQKGTISIAHNAELHRVEDLRRLEAALTGFLQRGHQARRSGRWRDFFFKNKAEKLLAAGLSLLLWLVFVQGFKPDTRSFPVAVQVQNVSEGLHVRGISPHRVTITVSGLKRELDLVTAPKIKAAVSMEGRGAGDERVLISEDQVRLPESVHFISAEPPNVEVELSAHEP
jgi:diadenylate cyclase